MDTRASLTVSRKAFFIMATFPSQYHWLQLLFQLAMFFFCRSLFLVCMIVMATFGFFLLGICILIMLFVPIGVHLKCLMTLF